MAHRRHSNPIFSPLPYEQEKAHRLVDVSGPVVVRVYVNIYKVLRNHTFT